MAEAVEAAEAQPGEAVVSATGEFLKQPLNAFYFYFYFFKFLLFKPATPNKRLASHTAQFSNQTRDYPGQGLTGPNSSQLVSTISVGAQHPCVFATSSLFPPVT